MRRQDPNATARERLLAERDELLRTVWRATSNAIADEGQPADPGDMASHTCDVDVALTVAESENAKAQEIDEALEQIDSGTYGRCRECGRRIGKARLEALPHATLCIRCQRRAETPFMRPQQGRGALWLHAVDYEHLVKSYFTADEEPNPCRGQLVGR